MKADLAAMFGVVALAVRKQNKTKVSCYFFFFQGGGRGGYSRQDSNNEENGFRGR